MVLWLNTFPTAGGISQTYSPRIIMTYCNLDYYKNYRVEFGRYDQTKEDAPPTNTTVERLQQAIYIGTTKNFQGSCNLISLRTGHRTTRKKFTPLPIPQYVIKELEDMAIKEDPDEVNIFTGRNCST